MKTKTSKRERSSLESSARVKAAAALVSTGTPVASAAKALGVGVTALRDYIESMSNARIGIGDTPIAATADLIVRLSSDILFERYSEPEDFGSIENPKDVSKAVTVFRGIMHYPDVLDEQIEKVALNAAEFVAKALGDNGEAMSDKLVLRARSVAAPVAASYVDKDDIGSIVIAETVVRRSTAASDANPQLTERAARILGLTEGLEEEHKGGEAQQ